MQQEDLLVLLFLVGLPRSAKEDSRGWRWGDGVVEIPFRVDEDEVGVGGHAVAVEEAVVTVEMKEGPGVVVTAA